MLYICTGPLLNPFSAFSSDLQNGNWRPNPFRSSFKLNRSQKHTPQEADIVQIAYFGMLSVINIGIFSYPNFFIGRQACEVPYVADLFVDNHAPRVIFDVLHDYYGKGTGTTGEDYGYASWTRSSHKCVTCWLMRLDMLPCSLHFREGTFFKGVSPLNDGPLAIAGALCERNQIIVNALNILHSNDGKEATIRSLHYLAAWLGWWDSAWFERQAIGSNDNSAWRTSGDNQGGVAKRGTDKEQQKEPQYIRRNGTGAKRLERTPTGQIIDDISNANVDVSYDGKTWFHLFGQSVSPNLTVTGHVAKSSKTFESTRHGL
jgi:hypothetical protein